MDHMSHMGHSGHEGMDHMQHSGMDHSQHAGHEAMQHNIFVQNAHAGMNHSGTNGSHLTMVHTNDNAHSMMMSMTFHVGSKEKILFECWDIDSVAGLLASFIAIFMVAMLYEGLKYYRKHLLWKAYAGLQYCAVAGPDKSATVNCPDDHHVIQPIGGILERKTPRMMSGSHAFQTLLHALQVLVSYMLMLVFMTYNVWLCLAVVLGAASGYFLFGWRESVVVDFTEHCH